MAKDVPKIQDKFKWSAIKRWMTDAGDAILSRTPTAGHYILVEDSADGNGREISVDTAALAGAGLGGGTVTVTTEDASGYAPGAGVGSVSNVDVITFDQDNFEIYDGGGGQCVVKLKTCPATCP